MLESQPNSVSLLDHIRERGHTFYVKKWFLNPKLERGMVLDLPAGRMRASRALQGLGYGVVSSDLFLGDSTRREEGMRWVHSDMTGGIPFADGTFDYLLNSEGIEHIPDQLAFLRDCARVLRSGGRLALTTPNLLSFRARAAFMLAGNRAFKSFVDEETSVWRTEGRKIYHGHAFLINYFQLRYMLHHAGFEIRGIVGTHYSTTSMFLIPFLLPFVWVFTRLAMRTARRKNPTSEIYGEILRHVLSPAMLLSRNLFVVASRRAEEQASSEESRRTVSCNPKMAANG